MYYHSIPVTHESYAVAYYQTINPKRFLGPEKFKKITKFSILKKLHLEIIQ